MSEAEIKRSFQVLELKVGNQIRDFPSANGGRYMKRPEAAARKAVKIAIRTYGMNHTYLVRLRETTRNSKHDEYVYQFKVKKPDVKHCYERAGLEFCPPSLIRI